MRRWIFSLWDPDAATALDGPLLETLVVLELVRQTAALAAPVSVHHFRTHDGHEVDAVLEDARGRVVGIEVKAGRTPSAADFRGLTMLERALGPRFVRGILLSTTPEVIPFSERLVAVPVDALFAP